MNTYFFWEKLNLGSSKLEWGFVPPKANVFGWVNFVPAHDQVGDTKDEEQEISREEPTKTVFVLAKTVKKGKLYFDDPF